MKFSVPSNANTQELKEPALYIYKFTEESQKHLS